MKNKKFLLASSILFAISLAGCGDDNTSNVLGPNDNNIIDDGGNNGPRTITKVGWSDYSDDDGNLTDNGFMHLIKDSYEFCEQVVAEGSVLLKNRNNCLPITKSSPKITLFGTGSKNLFMRSSVGGAAPNENIVVDLASAFEGNGFAINRTVYNKLKTVSNNELSRPNNLIEEGTSVYDQQAINSFNEYNDAAIITIVRAGTEDTDPSSSCMELSSNEKDLLKMVNDSGKFHKIIVLLNSPYPISMDWADKDEYGVDAILYVGVPGYYGAGGIAKIISGKVNPSGHLVDTYATSAFSSPAYQNFGDSNVVVYKEGVYVGYKYYETRYEDAMLNSGSASSSAGIYASSGSRWDYAEEMGYPFGYGLSYTTFTQKIKEVNYNKDKDQFDVTVEVENIGSVDGKASVQIYAQQPYTDFDKTNGLGKPSVSLMGYDKVDVKAGKKVTTTVSFDRYLLCTYDYVVNKSYILEGGDYYFAVGNGAHEAINNILDVKTNSGLVLLDHEGNIFYPTINTAKKVIIEADLNTYKKSIYNKEVEVTNQFDDADYNYYADKNTKQPITYLDRQDWASTWPTQTISSPAVSEDLDMSRKYDASNKNLYPSYSDGDGTIYNVTLEEPIAFTDMYNVPIEGTVKEGKFKGQDGEDVWNKFISQMSLDDLTISISDNRGILDVPSISKRGNNIAEGAEGLLAKFKYGDVDRWATGFPTGPLYTGTWDHNVQKKYGSFFAEEALFCGISCMNGPGCNIVRTPITSRASEYMSEDGMLNYYTASNVVSEARNKGLIMNIKNCLLNNQERGRKKLQTYCNEQAIREIYLRGFEGALTKGSGLGVEMSYNRIGATYTACSKSLMENVMRGEWGYKGLIIDSAYTGNNSDNYSNGPAMLYSGIDIFCLDGNRGNQIKAYILGNDDGALLHCLQEANKYILYALVNSSLGGTPTRVVEVTDYNNNNNNDNNGTTQPIESFNPITDEVKALADSKKPEVDPSSVAIPMYDEFDYQGEITSIEAGATSRGDINLVYVFEGCYAEGYNGDYSKTYGNLYLWEDGIFTGKVGNTTIKGFWYNDSNNDGKADCLRMVSNYSHYENITCDNADGFYDYITYVYLGFSWGQRSMVLSGYLAYEPIAIAVNTDTTELEYKVGDNFDASSIRVVKILQNLKYTNIDSDDSNLQFTVPDGLLSDNKFVSAGNYVIVISWKGLVTSVSISVTE
ncbi:MAG: glycoside hydrolase family 3 C-terminal domain-containing protein [Bacilli bacterium]|nr:glycoside hydrolase family 3 C-terminal domain-containing protein [Bacilli bacterium]